MTLATTARTGFIIGLGTAATVLYAAHLIAAIFTERVLAIDGANFFLGMLYRDLAWPLMDDWKHMRLLANVLSQFPASLAIKAGVEDLRVLKLLFGAGYFLVPVALSLICLALCHRARDYRLMVFLLASLITAWLPSELFKANPAFTAAALCWVPLAYAVLRLKVTLLDQAFAVVLLCVLFLSYEGVAVWGPILAVAGIWRLVQCDQRRPTRETWHIHAIAAAGMALPLFVVVWLSMHPVAESSERYLSDLQAMLPSAMWHNTGASRISLLVAAAMGVMLLALAVPPLRRRLRRGFSWRNPVYLVLVAMVLTSAALALHVAQRYIVEPWRANSIEYEYRTLIVFGTALWMGLAVLTQRLGFTFAPIERTVGFVLATGLATASLWQLGNTSVWHAAQREAKHVIDHSEKVIIPRRDIQRRFVEVGAPWLREMHRTGWHWGGYSIAIQNKRNVERFVSDFDPQFQVHLGANDPWPLRLSWVTFHRSGFFNFDAFLADYAVSGTRLQVERQHTLWAELQAIRAIAKGRTVLEPAEWLDGPDRDLYHRALWGTLVQRGEVGSSVPAGHLVLSQRASPRSLTPTHSIVFLYEPHDLTLMLLDEYRAITATDPVAQSKFNVHWLDDGKRLAWQRTPCNDADTAAPFLLHLRPMDTMDLPEVRRQPGFDNHDTWFQRAGGLVVEGRCWVAVNLPDYPIANVTTGQYDREGVIWQVSFPAPPKKERSRT